ncbi:MAG: hypothetical protein M1821_008227 [Bathelium mastoideum]|nr:MAG: hypothetical protein M1821_008227 [Bathelium mastoideum]
MRLETYPLYNATYTSFRVSPLFHGNAYTGSKSPLSDQSLKYHSKQLQDLLTKNSIRGVNLAQGSHDHTDTLQNCSWSLLGSETEWRNDINSETSSSSVTSENARGICIQLKYPRTTHCALLLRDSNNLPNDHPQFTTLPLLLLRMPASIRDVFLNYLQLTFDCNISSHPLRSIDTILELFISNITHHDPSWSHFTLHPPSPPQILQTLQIQLAFPTVAPLLKNIDISIAPEDLLPFLDQGNLLVAAHEHRRQQQHCHHGPLLAALSHHLDRHCGLCLDQEGIRIAKVVCGAFALSVDGKVKIYAPEHFELEEADVNASTSRIEEVPQTPVQIALQELYAELVAQVMPIEEDEVREPRPQDSMTGSSQWQGTKEQDKARSEVVDLVGRARSPVKRLAAAVRTQPTTSDLPDSPPPPYALHDLNLGGRLVE